MSEAQRKSGCFRQLARVIGLVVLVAISRSLFTGLEVLASAFRGVGIHDPVIAWGLVGALVGALVGFIVGLRRNGRRKQLPEMTLAAGAILLLAYAGVDAAGIDRPSPRGGPEETTPPVLYTGLVNAPLLNVRSGPSNRAAPIDEVAHGVPLDVMKASEAWLQVRYYTAAGTVRTGWVYRGYVDRASPPESENGVAGDGSRLSAKSVFLPCRSPGVGTRRRLGSDDRDELQQTFEGTIGDDLAVRVSLHVEGGEVSGSYYYLDQQKPIRLEGTCIESGLLHMNGYYEGEHTDVFHAEVRKGGTVLLGRWSAVGHPRSLSFAARATAD